MNILSKFIATGAGTGYFPVAPGTFGSLPALLLFNIVLQNIDKLNAKLNFILNVHSNSILSVVLVHLIFTLLIYIVGHSATKIYIGRKIKSDPKEVVIDEIAGQYLASALSHTYIIYNAIENYPEVNLCLLYITPFLFFRLFDILKPWPISFIDQNIKGAHGIMLDDILAGLAAGMLNITLIALVIKPNYS